VYLRGGGGVISTSTRDILLCIITQYICDVCDGVAIARLYTIPYISVNIYLYILLLLCGIHKHIQRGKTFIVVINIYGGAVAASSSSSSSSIRSADSNNSNTGSGAAADSTRTGSRINKLHVQVYPLAPSARRGDRGTCRRRRFRACAVGRAPALSPPPRSDRKSHPVVVVDVSTTRRLTGTANSSSERATAFVLLHYNITIFFYDYS